MEYKILLFPRAEKEITESADWYESQRKNLGKRFLICIDKSFSSIIENPLKYALTKGNFRQTKVDVFPYVIIFQVSEKDILIHSVFNTWQNPLKKP